MQNFSCIWFKISLKDIAGDVQTEILLQLYSSRVGVHRLETAVSLPYLVMFVISMEPWHRKPPDISSLGVERSCLRMSSKESRGTVVPQTLTGRVSREALEINILPRLNPLWKKIRVFREATEIERQSS